MKYTPSINIAQTAFNPESYIVTQNAKSVVGNIVDSFNAGVHSFNIIGSYGRFMWFWQTTIGSVVKVVEVADLHAEPLLPLLHRA